MHERAFEAFINPFQFLEVDEGAEAPAHDEILRFLCTPGLDTSPESFARRYREVNEVPSPAVVPAEARILEKLIWPVRHAKAAYVTGNYLGTIALCGFVAEMVAILLFDMAEVRVNQEPMTEGEQLALFGRTFEKLGQERRVQVLHAYGIVGQEEKAHFDLIRTTRRKFLHVWSQDHDELRHDARAAYGACIAVVSRLIPQRYDKGHVVLTEEMFKYLQRHGGFEHLGDPKE